MLDRRGDSAENWPDWGQIAREAAHRPWPPPSRRWLLAQTWRDLLFAHWPLRPEAIQPLLPAGLALDTFAGEAWIGVIPFDIAHLAPRSAPRGLRLAFLELNVRTYVIVDGKPGVWFFSLDAESPTAVRLARATYHLPYHWARMRMNQADGWISYVSRRVWGGAAGPAFSGRFQPVGPVALSLPGSLEYWLTERYCLYVSDSAGRLSRGEINHPPWPLQPAAAEIEINSMAAAHGIPLAGQPLLHFARRLDVVAWSLERVG
jgi:uncharacterized protein YqjF (DUF2071 family)